jgi:phospholipid/cholesterol/gamma-HCH transport system substrate-binding protein
VLAGNDEQVGRVNEQLADVLRTLSSDRDELSDALRTLGIALGDIQGFIKDNRAAIKSNVDKLAQTTQVLVDRRAALAETLDVAPLAVTNVLDSFDPSSRTLQGRANLDYFFPLPTAGPVHLGGGSR